METTPTRCALWARVSTGGQDEAAQVPEMESLAASRGWEVARRYALNDLSAYKGEHKAVLRQALADAHKGEFSVLVVWALDRIVREGAEDALRTVRLLRQSGCTLVSVQEPWLNGSPEIEDVLLSFAAWLAQQESKRKSERMRAWHAQRKAKGLHAGRTQGAADKTPRKRSGYVARWERERAERQRQPE